MIVVLLLQVKNAMNLLLIDNYDSFTWNLHQLLQKTGSHNIGVVKNDCIDETLLQKADAFIFSPGPGLPNDAGKMKSIIMSYASKKKMLGVCLGHQAIGEVFGAKIVRSNNIYHGVQTKLNIHSNIGIFKNIPQHTLVGRYHSWVISKSEFPENLEITATDDSGNIMAIKHKNLDITGIQFHPESIMTPTGMQMLKNWLYCTY